MTLPVKTKQLATFQRAMHDFVFYGTEPDAIANTLVDYSEDELRERLSIYQNNTYYSLIEAIKDLYPSVVATIGEELVGACAREWLEHNPPTSPAMVAFGQGFNEFIGQHPTTQDFAYIGDLATFDLLQHQSYHAADDQPLAPDAFTELKPEALANSRIQALDSVRLFRSDFAVFDIWRLASGQTEDPVNADTPQHILIIRPKSEVAAYELNPAFYGFFHSLLHAQTLQEALEVATEIDEKFNPTQAIQLLVQSEFTHKIIGE
ncbi:MAG: DNA-binding domain-containing protein [Agarilytica sp.]